MLDPATGTGTFLVEVIDVIHRKLVTKWQSEGRRNNEMAKLWNEYVPSTCCRACTATSCSWPRTPSPT